MKSIVTLLSIIFTFGASLAHAQSVAEPVAYKHLATTPIVKQAYVKPKPYYVKPLSYAVGNHINYAGAPKAIVKPVVRPLVKPLAVVKPIVKRPVLKKGIAKKSIRLAQPRTLTAQKQLKAIKYVHPYKAIAVKQLVKPQIVAPQPRKVLAAKKLLVKPTLHATQPIAIKQKQIVPNLVQLQPVAANAAIAKKLVIIDGKKQYIAQ